MIANIDFSIFSSPSKAYGNITGKLTVPENIKVGDNISISDEKSIQQLKIISISQVESEPSEIIFGLNDVVFNSIEEANEFIKKIEKDKILFFDPY